MLRNPTRDVPETQVLKPRTRLLVGVPVFLAVMVLVNVVTSAASGRAVTALLAGATCAVGALALYSVLVRRFERRTVSELAVAGAPRRLGGGVALGVGLFAAVVLVLTFTGTYRVAGLGSVGGFVTTLGLMAAVAVAEELVFRAVLFRLVEELAGTWGALVASGLVFGGLHLVNPGATGWGALAIAVEGGAMTAAAYAATRSLWLPIGLHLGWNLAEGGVFGVVVSGSDHSSGSLLRGIVEGPVLLSGGTVGPEAGLPAVLICSVLTVVLLRRAHRNGGIRPFPAHRRTLSA